MLTEVFWALSILQMQEKNQNGRIQLETFEVPKGTLMLLIKAACGMGLELYLLFAKHTSCGRRPTVASARFSASHRESPLYSSTFHNLNTKPQLVSEFGRGQVCQVVNGIYSKRSHLFEAEAPPWRQFTVSQGDSPKH